MKPEVKAAWVADLRSGEYVQGQGTLCSTDRDGNEKHCCLGVLLDGQTLGGWEMEDHKLRDLECGYITTASYTYVTARGGSRNGCVLPDSLRRRMGISEPEQEELTKMNDSKRWRFGQIADWIEEHL